ncbi:Heparinase [Sphingobium herbicidovorans NBRC 16415]|uniref:Heparinase n=1 Tax=Sphingobium herbicidovorans (strain ATCC 700291 / DSM 11019 / CCUG 56400 / KCTC 2939 / LMG 18315 / NBRC 16415 / MH) TaxID=1219045 RepID=A0A086P4Y1_SPHHM|nr:heparinase II/III family protein [Sphingobium herbicidovorans]KFG88449.1 Heparinase [Sphingobium herbicidovorans NBRC 16415]
MSDRRRIPRPSIPDSGGSEPADDEIEQGKRLIRVADDKGLSLAERIANRFYLMSWKTPIHGRRLKGKYPLKLLAVPDDEIPGDPKAGQAIRAGYFLFRGLKQPVGTLTFERMTMIPAFADYLHSFAWLRDLASAATREQGAPIAEAVLRKWLEVHSDTPSEPAWRADNAGWRLLFWSAHAPFILSSSDLVYRSLVLNCIARTARHLDRGADKAPLGLPRLVAWGGIVAASMLLPGGAARKIFGEAGLKRALENAVHGDGGIVSRSPVDQLEAIMLLAMVRAVYDVRREQVPPFITEALGRMVPALLGLSHGDGGLGSWQGAGAIDPATIEAVVRASRVRARPLRQASDWGYQRLVAGATIVQVDAAPPPVARLADAGCASTTAIEISDGPQRLIVNCGGAALSGAWMPDGLAQALRTTAAHSTLVLDDSNSTALLPDGTLGRGVTEVELHRQEQESGSRIEISHDGYVRRMGYVHRRLLLVSSDGKEIRGEDMLTPASRRRKPAKLPAQLRFHLAPGVEPTATADGMGALLRIDLGAIWQFRANMGKLTIEESLWVDSEGRPHESRQLVITAEALPGGSTVGWLFKRVG